LNASNPPYEYQPHERPFMPGSPATPDHPTIRRVGYAAIGVLVSLTAGLANGLLLANLPTIQGALGLTAVEAGWLPAAYMMTNICMSFVLIKARQQFGIQRFTRVFLIAFVLLAAAQVWVNTYRMELALRAVAGIVAGGFTPLGFFYLMQGLPRKARIAGMLIGIGLTQVATPLARAISPLLLADGDIQTLFLFEFALSLACLGSIALLRLPPGDTIPAFEKLDVLTFVLLAPGMALLCAALVQGRTVWWTTPWVGYALVLSMVLIGAALMVEHHRANPMLNTRWMTSAEIIRFALVAATIRLLLSEQNFGAMGLLTVTGMGAEQLVTFWTVVTLSTLAGLIVGILTLNPQDLLRPIVISIALIGIGAVLDSDASNLTRPANLYFSQALLAFAAMYFLGPTMMTGLLMALSRGPSHIISFSAVFGIAQALGGLGGAALLGSFQVMRQRVHSQELVASILMTDPQVAGRVQALSGAYGRVLTDPALREAQGLTILTQQVSREAQILAFNDVFRLIALLALAAFLWQGGRWLYFRVKGINPFAAELAFMQKMMAGRR
jgi:MFS family permease